ncbi:SUMF1/EgtB/PvdO family nonheme iron enzyme [Planctomycetota bacterium]
MPALRIHYDRREWIGIVTAFGMVLLNTGVLNAALPRIGFLAVESSLDEMGPHNRAAWQTAVMLGRATLLLRQKNGSFADSSGNPRNLSDFDVVWYHQGDAIGRNLMYQGRSLAEIHQFAESGCGVLLSGGALAMVAQLRLETEIRPQRHELGNWRDPAGMVPVEKTHPAFNGLEGDPGIVWLSRGGCRAVADFYWGGPAEGMILAKAPSGPENPLVEYVLGEGRVIVFGWYWPDYADSESPHRGNLIRLTLNLLNYLADGQAWRPFILRSMYPPVASPDDPSISQQRWRALCMAIDDLSVDFPERYLKGDVYLRRLRRLRAEHDHLSPTSDPRAYAAIEKQFEDLKNEALLANPLLSFDRLLMIRRRADQLGLPVNFNGNPDIEPTGYDNTLVTFSPVRPSGELKMIYRPEGDRFIGDVDLHYDADRLLLSMPDAVGRWGVTELHLYSGRLIPLPLIDEPDVHNYDACYLPDGRIVFTSTAPFIGVPCVGGRSKVANLYLREHEGCIRRLTNDQDHNWCPTVLNNGRILYQRWEYTDIAHAFMRLLFHSNPDGSRQMEYYGSNSFWPTAMFFARPVPNHPTKVVAVIGGHHDPPRQGELVIFDPAMGRHEASGAVQRIPGFGKKVEPVVLDGLIGSSWPRFLHPYPLSEKYFLVSCKPTKTSLWGIYLVDVFDNFVLLYEESGRAMLEPIPLQKTQRQPVMPDMVQPNQKEATVLLMDVYYGPGLQGVPRGTVKSLRLISYEFTFHGFGGEPDRVGFDGPWDVKRILGTVPVETDGSAHFRVPAHTPVAVQPLDAEGKALALMRSWFTAMPGEVVSCVGCHEPQNFAPPVQSMRMAVLRAPSKIKPWYGPPRGFSFVREVQPVLDAYCIQCHHARLLDNGQKTFDLTARPAERVPSSFQMHFTPSYVALHRFIHIPTLESDAHLLPARDFHADTSKLIQILRDGHYGVHLDSEAWDRLITWIDLNAPAHGSWKEVVGHIPAKAKLVAPGAARRRELHRRYAGIDEDPEAVYPAAVLSPAVRTQPLGLPRTRPVNPQELPLQDSRVVHAGHLKPKPSSASESMSIALADGVTLELVRVPSGQFVMGTEQGYANERPAHPVVIDNAFWMGRFEVTNRQYACFDPEHDSGLETGEVYQFGDYERGHPLRRPEQPVVRVSWNQAMAFCDRLSNKTGRRFTLPTEIQWEYGCRSGGTNAFWYGSLDDDFSRSANLSDATHHTVDYPHVPAAVPPWRPADTRFDDGWRVSAPVGTFQPNPWGLFDMHGNVAEWTRSTYHPYPLITGDGQDDRTSRKTVRGGSWLDRPRRARSAFRIHYEPSQAVHDVGFRVVCEDVTP